MGHVHAQVRHVEAELGPALCQPGGARTGHQRLGRHADHVDAETTLLTLIGCLARPTQGRVLFRGRLLSDLPEPHPARVRRQIFDLAFQRFNLVPGLSALHNVMLPAYALACHTRNWWHAPAR